VPDLRAARRKDDFHHPAWDEQAIFTPDGNADGRYVTPRGSRHRR
jgi:hypothetical protein